MLQVEQLLPATLPLAALSSTSGQMNSVTWATSESSACAQLLWVELAHLQLFACRFVMRFHNNFVKQVILIGSFD